MNHFSPDIPGKIAMEAELDFSFFVKLVRPNLLTGQCHEELMRGMSDLDNLHLLIVYPRGHLKTTLVQLWCCWMIIRRPDVTILYISAVATLSIAALRFIKDVLESSQVRKYWPQLLNPNPNKRVKWTENGIIVDHPRRKMKFLKDDTILAVGVDATIAGMHFDVGVFDDIEEHGNSDTSDKRAKLLSQYSYLMSVLNPKATIRVAGTYYALDDLYHTLKHRMYQVGKDKNKKLFKTIERSVQDADGNYLWPRAKDSSGNEFGFDDEVLDLKKADYMGNDHLFYAQYFNQCIDVSKNVFRKEYFKYYDPNHLIYDVEHGKVFLSSSDDERIALNTYAFLDVAYTVKAKSDFSALTVVGVDKDMRYYLLCAERWKSNNLEFAAKRLAILSRRFSFRKFGTEGGNWQASNVKLLKQELAKLRCFLSTEEINPATRGNKILYIETLASLYELGNIFHPNNGMADILENELLQLHITSIHDDVADSWAYSVKNVVPPSAVTRTSTTNLTFHNKFGGVSPRRQTSY